MPFYEYRCQDCGHQFEKLVRNEREIPRACPNCGKESLKKLFSTFSTGSSSSSGPACTDGSCARSNSCSTGTCPTGTCPF